MDTLSNVITSLYQIILSRDISLEELNNRIVEVPAKSDPALYALQLARELISSEEYNERIGIHPSPFKITNADIYYAYKFLLGRAPESEHVYNSKKQSNNIEELLKAIITSDEFKSNDILKDTISLRRRTADLNITHSEMLQENKIIVLSGCQAKTIADLFQAKTGLTAVPHLFMSHLAINSFVEHRAQDHFKILSSFNLIYTQKYEIFQTLKRIPELQEKARLIPLIECAAFQPDQVYITNNSTLERVIGPLGEYQSLIATAAYYAGLTIEECVTLYQSDTYLAFGFGSASKLSRTQLITSSEDIGYPMNTLVSKWDSQEPWMRTINHPKKFVLSDLVDYALSMEGIEILENVDQYVIDDLAASVDWPTYVDKNGDSRNISQLRFKVPPSMVPKANAAVFLNLTEFVGATYKSLQSLKMKDIHAKQLNQEINIEEYVDKISPF